MEGKTGSGKTHVINQLSNSIDLEGIANHRGSAFGKRLAAQPVQINFENQLAVKLLKLPDLGAGRIILEDESRAIGSLSIPQSLYNRMKQAPIAVLEESLDKRIDTILNDYIISNYHEFKVADPTHYQDAFSEYLLGSLERISRRLGGENFQQLKLSMEQALARPETDFSAHREWISTLLSNYYDPMYEYQLGSKSTRVVFRGSRAELISWAAHLPKPQQSIKARSTGR